MTHATAKLSSKHLKLQRLYLVNKINEQLCLKLLRMICKSLQIKNIKSTLVNKSLTGSHLAIGIQWQQNLREEVHFQTSAPGWGQQNGRAPA